MLHCGYANATEVPLCTSNRKKLENMKFEPNNTHTLCKQQNLAAENFVHLLIILRPVSPCWELCPYLHDELLQFPQHVDEYFAKVLLFQVSTSVETALDQFPGRFLGRDRPRSQGFQVQPITY